MGSLVSCYVMPNNVSPCPSASELADLNSLAHRCHLSCPAPQAAGISAVSGGGASTKPASGIPVSPLPGESLGQTGSPGAGAPQSPIMPGVGQQSPAGGSGSAQPMRIPAVAGADAMGVSRLSSSSMRQESASPELFASLTFAVVLLAFS